MDELSLQEANRFQGEQVVDQEGVWVFKSTDDTSIKMRDTYVWGMYIIIEAWLEMLNGVSKFTCGRQRVPVKHCLLCNFPAAQPWLLLQPHCEMSEYIVANLFCTDMIYLKDNKETYTYA